MEFTQGERCRIGGEESSKLHQQRAASENPYSSTNPRWQDGGGGGGASGYSVAHTNPAGGTVNENHGNNHSSQFVEKEHMFDKVVTPSDVGKLNRLVIPKQHAEKYFPLDSSANEKGMLLSFEDRIGKPWRFRYSYWNSSQSYVITKGWSRFVKEKRLDAGDTVSFGRGLGEAKSRLFIDWKRRPDNRDHQTVFPRIPITGGVPFGRSVGPWGGRWPVYDQNYFNFAYNAVGSSNSNGQFLYFQSPAGTMRPPEMQFAVQQHAGAAASGGGSFPMVLNSVPVSSNQTAAKRVRLFGVNLDCQVSDSEAVARSVGDHRSSCLQHYQGSSSGGNALQLIDLYQNNGAESSGASSSSTSKEQQHSNLDLDL